ncbi:MULTISPECIES: hypothetical protein [Haloplanus]|uniref:Uncharacterized protein n=1 Tax=Haloplanus litoreus TaxID=767515 RepID=A0ABD6A1U1_9EURY
MLAVFTVGFLLRRR